MFKIHYNYFKYQIILLRLTNISIMFQKYINIILAKKLNIFIIVYQDNIFIYTEIGRKRYIKVV